MVNCGIVCERITDERKQPPSAPCEPNVTVESTKNLVWTNREVNCPKIVLLSPDCTFTSLLVLTEGELGTTHPNNFPIYILFIFLICVCPLFWLNVLRVYVVI